eukprot:XP_011668224.1 PREDICTED: uncharacterized protein LOC100890059 isoform X2 [Strongylocentrotus purpuratus]
MYFSARCLCCTDTNWNIFMWDCVNSITVINGCCESDADLTDMAQRSAHVPGVTDTASSRRKNDTAHVNLSSIHNRQKLNMHQSQKMRVAASSLKPSMKSENPSKIDKQRASREPPSLKDLRPEDKKRVANLIRELAKTGEEKEVAKEQLEVERKENEMKTRTLQAQIEAILCERENIQQQYLDCQKLLSSYQSKVSEEHKNLSGSLHDHPSSQKGHQSNEGWSPVKESARTISPTPDRPASKAGQEFRELQSVPIHFSENKSHHTTDFIAPPGPRQNGGPSEQQFPNNHHGISERQFNPVLSSTHRKHHRSRLPSTGAEDMRATQSENTVNGFSSSQTHGHDQSKQINSHNLSKTNGSQREGSRRTSQETFFPLTEVADESAVTHVPHARRLEGREKRKSSDRNSWVSLPEMDEQVPYSYELHEKGLGQDGTFSGSTSHQKRLDYRSLTPEQRQRQLGSLKKKLQQEQGWLQQKLQDQERLLYHKRLEVERQKQELSHLEDTGYDQVRREYLGGRAGQQQRERTGVGGEYRTRFDDRNDGFEEDGYHKRVVPEGGKDEVTSPWQQYEEQPVSTNYPPDDYFGEMDQQQLTRRRAGDQFDNYRGKNTPGYAEDSDIDYQEYDDEDEVEDEETWYEMREETEGADNGRSIQGYASLHPQQATRKQGAIHQPAATDPATFQSYQSYHNSSLRDTVNGAEVRSNRGYPTSEPQKQYGNITTLLDEEGLTGLSLNGSNPPYMTRPRTKPRPETTTTTTPKRRVNVQPHQTHRSQTHTQHQAEMRMHSVGPDRTRERDRMTKELYMSRSQQGKTRDIKTRPATGQARMNSTGQSRMDSTGQSRMDSTGQSRMNSTGQVRMDSTAQKGSLHSYADATEDDALHAHLVQRSHQVIQEIGMLLNQSAEMGEEEESKVLEDVFFLK